MAAICTLNTSQVDSSDFALTDGVSTTLSLFGATGPSVPPNCTALIQKKASNNEYITEQVLTSTQTSVVLQAIGTWRVRKLASTVAVGVDRD